MIEELLAAPLSADAYAPVLSREFAERYLHGSDRWTGEEAMATVTAWFAGALGSEPVDVLDAGAGRGLASASLARLGHRVTGVDLVAVDEWAAVTEDADGRVHFVAGDVASLAGTARFDAADDNGCFHHQHPDRYHDYLTSIHRQLRPGGLFQLCVFEAARTGRLYQNNDQRLHRAFTAEEIVPVVESAGFTVTARRSVPRSLRNSSYLVVQMRRQP